ncbi:MAG: amino acid carrier protein [Mariprofundus sp.]|nr:amino acid carrier protein [Mariprofundus sp.]
MLESISSWMWSPFLVFIYLEIGILFIILTRNVVWSGIRRALVGLWAGRKSEATGDGHVSQFNGFFAALAATVGVGNLAGVATAIHLGGPGALFWMWVSAILGMSFRMCSVYWAVRLAKDNDDPKLFATPMLYIIKMLSKSWKPLAIALAFLLMANGMVMANLIQSNSVAQAMTGETGSANLIIALLIAAAVGAVIIGGMKGILTFSSKIAPWMIVAYLLAGWGILASDPVSTLKALGSVFYYAFTPYAVAGGVAGYAILETMQYGISRGVFSHGSGVGFATFWQGANDGSPAQSAFLAAAVPLVDTILVCTTTGLVVLLGDMWLEETGAFLTVSSFEHFLGEGGLLFISACLVVFAFTTMISWAHFGERCFEYLGGTNIIGFRWFFVFVAFCGPFLPLASLWSLGDIIIGSMLIVHLIPLTYIVVRHAKRMRADLSSENI